jgi:hypothetical protein
MPGKQADSTSNLPQEINDLSAIVARDLSEAGGAISADWRYGIAI